MTTVLIFSGKVKEPPRNLLVLSNTWRTNLVLGLWVFSNTQNLCLLKKSKNCSRPHYWVPSTYQLRYIANFPFDNGSQYPPRWHNWTFSARLPGNVTKLPVFAQFHVTGLFSLFLEVKLNNFPTRESSKSSLYVAAARIKSSIHYLWSMQLQLRWINLIS